MHAALKQETENIYHFWHPSHRTEVKYSQPYTPTKTDRSETRDPCSLKDDDVLLLKQFGHRGFQLKLHPGNIAARRARRLQARVLLDMAVFH